MSCQLNSNKRPNQTASVTWDLIFQRCQIEMSKLVKFISWTEDLSQEVQMYRIIWNSVSRGRGTRVVLGGEDFFQRGKLLKKSKWILGIKREFRRNGGGEGRDTGIILMVGKHRGEVGMPGLDSEAVSGK